MRADAAGSAVVPQGDTGGAALRAALWMLGSIVSFTALAIAGRAVSPALDTFEIMLYRSAIGVVVVLAMAAATGRLAELRTARPGDHAIRNVVHFAGQNLWFLAIAIAPLAQVIALEFTAPLWVLLLAPVILGETVRARQIGVALVGFAGVVLVAQPFSGTMSPGLVWAALAALGFAVTNLLTRRLTRGDTVLGIMFWLTAIQLVLGLACAGIDGDVARPDAATAPWLAVIGLAGLVAHFCLTNALRLAPASTIMPVDFVRLPIIAVAGALLYGESLDPLVILGGAVILGAAWANLLIARRPA